MNQKIKIKITPLYVLYYVVCSMEANCASSHGPSNKQREGYSPPSFPAYCIHLFVRSMEYGVYLGSSFLFLIKVQGTY